MPHGLLRSELGANQAPAKAVGALVERICRGTEFGQSTRSQEILRYLCNTVLKNPDEKVTEHQIGVSVFGWNPDRDCGHDTSVRVQISHLRKRLEHYFASEGLHEPVVIRLPKGSYAPVFEVRDDAADLLRPTPVPIPQTVPARRRLAVPLLIVTNLATLAVAVALVMWPKTAAGPTVASPNLDQFWLPFRGRPAQVVLSDGNLVVVGEMLNREITLHEYRNHFNGAGLVRSSATDPAIRSLADRVLPTHLTGTQDVDVFGMISSVLSRYRVPVGSVAAPDFQMSQLDNVILLGHPRVNPWVHLFDDRLNFHYQFDFKEHKGQILNLSPVAGEQAVYTAEFGNHGYCVVACLPKPIGEGTALLLFGSDMSSLEAGGRFVTDDQWIARLYGRFHVTAKNAPRHFEVLLRPSCWTPWRRDSTSSPTGCRTANPSGNRRRNWAPL